MPPSKAGLIGMSKALAQEVASRSITVNCVAPGFIATAMTDALPEAQKDALLGADPGGQLGEGADIAAARGLSRQPRGGLRHRADAARERRHGDDLSAARARSSTTARRSARTKTASAAITRSARR